MKIDKTLCLITGIFGIVALATIGFSSDVTLQGNPQNVTPTVGNVTIYPTDAPTAINPATTFYVLADVNDENGQADIVTVNISCYGIGGTEGTDSWDSLSLLNSSFITWTSLNTTAWRVNGTFNSSSVSLWSTKSINGTWTCKVYANDTSVKSAVATNSTALTVSKTTGISLGNSTCIFDADDPGASDKQWDCTGGTVRNNTVTHDGNVGTNVTINGTDLTGSTDNSWVIGVGNVTYNSTYTLSNNGTDTTGGTLPGYALSASLTEIVDLWPRGSSPTNNATNTTAWIDFPKPLKSQLYEGTISLLSEEDPA